MTDKRILSLVMAVVLSVSSLTTPCYAQSTPDLTALKLMSVPGTPVFTTPSYHPAVLKGLVIDSSDPFQFGFIVLPGEQSLSENEKKTEYTRLMKYFLAALAVPDNDQWVNLSPFEKDRIVPDNFGMTEMGRDLLAQDYLLKQLASSLTHPDTALGQKFWDRVYAKAHERFGTSDIPAETINKVWIIPDRALIHEQDNKVYVLESRLKVMLEADYLAMKNSSSSEENTGSRQDQLAREIMREIIIPEIEKEVNEGRNFAPLRQVYSGMLLATWYKRSLKESALGRIYADRGKVNGIDLDPAVNAKIYDQYLKAFEKGVFNLIREDVDHLSQELIPHKYFSGGFRNSIQFTKAADGAMKIANEPPLDYVDIKLMKWVEKVALGTFVATVTALNTANAGDSNLTFRWDAPPRQEWTNDWEVVGYRMLQGTNRNNMVGVADVEGENVTTMSISVTPNVPYLYQVVGLFVPKGETNAVRLQTDPSNTVRYMVRTTEDPTATNVALVLTQEITRSPEGILKLSFKVKNADGTPVTQPITTKFQYSTNMVDWHDLDIEPTNIGTNINGLLNNGLPELIPVDPVEFPNMFFRLAPLTPDAVKSEEEDPLLGPLTPTLPGNWPADPSIPREDPPGTYFEDNPGAVNDTPADNSQSYGGIDLNEKNLRMDVTKTGDGVIAPSWQQRLERLNIQGLYPLILEIKSVNPSALF